MRHLVPRFQLSKLEGDAVFVHAPDTSLARGETVLDAIQATYAAFRDAIRAIDRDPCDCDACRRSPTLDLKFVVHHGAYGIHRVAGSEELIGSDVALAHRLLKNGVAHATGWRGYALFSRDAIDRMGVSPAGAPLASETYDLGTVETVGFDLDARYRAFANKRRVAVEPAGADITIARGLPAPPHVVWEWLNDPTRRREWDDVIVDDVRPDPARPGTGDVTRCVRGGEVMLVTVLDWRPFEYFTVRTAPPGSGDGYTTTYRPGPKGGTTELVVTMRLEGGPIRRVLARRAPRRRLERSIDRLAASLARDRDPLLEKTR